MLNIITTKNELIVVEWFYLLLKKRTNFAFESFFRKSQLGSNLNSLSPNIFLGIFFRRVLECFSN